LLWNAVGTTDETILLEYIWPLIKHSWLKWSHDKYNHRDKGLGLAYSLQNANKKLLTACQHWNHDITCLSDWVICRHHSQL